MIDHYNDEVIRYQSCCIGKPKAEWPDVDNFLNFDSKRMTWTREVKQDLGRQKIHAFDPNGIVRAVYRPFTKSWMYFNQHFNNCVYKMPSIFPEDGMENLVICVTGRGATKEFCAFVSNVLPDLEMVSKSQCFPLKVYEANDTLDDQQNNQSALNFTEIQSGQSKYTVKDGITDAGLAHFQEAYPGEKITKEDLFYYVYGLLHSEDYKSRYADNLTKELPRIPRVKTAADFWAFSKAGRALADLHINYETVEPYPVQFEGGSLLLETFKPEDFRVEQMKFAKGMNGEKYDKTRVIYNHKITMTGIPLTTYDYVVNGKPALEWVMERQAVTTHKESGIVNDANLWATETMGDAAYPLKLFQRVITVSLKTMEIVRSLPKL